MVSKTLKLAEKIEVAGDTISEVTLRTPKAGDYLHVERKGKGDQHRSLLMISRLSGLTDQAAEELEEVDVNRISERIEALKNELVKRAEALDAGKD